MRKIAPVATLGQINNIGSDCALKFIKRTAPGSNRKLTSTSAHAKKIAVSELLEITPVASIGQINNILSDLGQNFKKDVSRAQPQINEHDRAH